MQGVEDGGGGDGFAGGGEGGLVCSVGGGLIGAGGGVSSLRMGRGGDKRLGEIIHKHRCAFAHGGNRILVDLRVGWEDALC